MFQEWCQAEEIREYLNFYSVKQPKERKWVTLFYFI